MPQLSPLPWLLFVMISFFPMILAVMVGKLVSNSVGISDKKDVVVVKLNW